MWQLAHVFWSCEQFYTTGVPSQHASCIFFFVYTLRHWWVNNELVTFLTGPHRSRTPVWCSDPVGARGNRSHALRASTNRWRHSHETLAPHYLQICAGIWREFNFLILETFYCYFTWLSKSKWSLFSLQLRCPSNAATKVGKITNNFFYFFIWVTIYPRIVRNYVKNRIFYFYVLIIIN